MALMADGVAPNDVYKVLATPAGVDRAFKKLDTIKKDLVFWKSGAQPPQLLASGEVVMAWAYNGRIDAANVKDKRNFGVVWNQSLFTIDSWVILKNSANKDAAYKFINFAGKADTQAKIPESIAYGVTNREANALIPAARRAVFCQQSDELHPVADAGYGFLAGEWRQTHRALQQLGVAELSGSNTAWFW